MSTEPRERMRDSLHVVQERGRAVDAGRYVRPSREDDDHGPEMLAAVACICTGVLVAIGAWVLWASGVLS